MISKESSVFSSIMLLYFYNKVNKGECKMRKEHIFSFGECFKLPKGYAVNSGAKIVSDIEGDFLVTRVMQTKKGMCVYARNLKTENIISFFQTGGYDPIIRDIFPDKELRKKLDREKEERNEIYRKEQEEINKVLLPETIEELNKIVKNPDISMEELKSNIKSIAINLDIEI